MDHNLGLIHYFHSMCISILAQHLSQTSHIQKQYVHVQKRSIHSLHILCGTMLDKIKLYIANDKKFGNIWLDWCINSMGKKNQFKTTHGKNNTIGSSNVNKKILRN